MMPRGGAALALLGMSLVGCASTRTLYFAGRGDAPSGQATARTAYGDPTGAISVVLGGETYSGRWVDVAGPGSTSTVSSTGLVGRHPFTATGTSVAPPTGGTGSVVLTGPRKDWVRCWYVYSEWSSSGMGECADDRNRGYDLQITR